MCPLTPFRHQVFSVRVSEPSPGGNAGNIFDDWIDNVDWFSWDASNLVSISLDQNLRRDSLLTITRISARML